jgi:hypothetical protein
VRNVALFGRPAEAQDGIDFVDCVTAGDFARMRIMAQGRCGCRRLGESFAITTPLRDDGRQSGSGLNDVRLRLRCRDDFQQVEIARRVEEVGAEPVLPEIVAPPFGERGDRNARRVGTDNRAGAARGINLLQQAALYVQPLRR